MNIFAQIVIWLNVPFNAMGKYLFGFIGVLPGWLSNTIISAVTGVILLIIFKYTSNQKAIGRVRDDIKAHMLALKLFKDSISVTVRAQGRVFRGAFLLLFHAIRPMLVMIVPVCLLFGQMGLWYQARPLEPGEQALVTMQLNGETGDPWPDVSIEPTTSLDVTVGPVRLKSNRQICWQIQARKEGYHRILFQVDGQEIEKELSVGNGFMRVSVQRPGQNGAAILLHPWEKPFDCESVVQSIAIDYPDRPGRTCGTDWWLIYFFIASLVFALIFKPFLKVRI